MCEIIRIYSYISLRLSHSCSVLIYRVLYTFKSDHHFRTHCKYTVKLRRQGIGCQHDHTYIEVPMALEITYMAFRGPFESPVIIAPIAAGGRSC